MKTPKSFICKRCGSCCMASPFLSANEIKRIKNLGYKEDFFVESLRGKKFMKVKDGKCIFLNIGNSASCNIYKNRPSTCRKYPIEIRYNGDCKPEVLAFDKR